LGNALKPKISSPRKLTLFDATWKMEEIASHGELEGE
jgi:hypothetical protein